MGEIWVMQVKLFENNKPIWKSAHATGSRTPYEYTTKKEAEDMLNMCYPLQSSDEVRVHRIK